MQHSKKRTHFSIDAGRQFPEKEEERLAGVLRVKVLQLTDQSVNKFISDSGNFWDVREVAQENGVPFKQVRRGIRVPESVADTLESYMNARLERMREFGRKTPLLEVKLLRQLQDQKHALTAALRAKIIEVAGFEEAGRMLLEFKKTILTDFSSKTKAELLVLATKRNIEADDSWTECRIRQDLLVEQIGRKTVEYFRGERLVDLINEKCATKHWQLCLCPELKTSLLESLRGVTVETLSSDMYKSEIRARVNLEKNRDMRCQDWLDELKQDVPQELFPLEDGNPLPTFMDKVYASIVLEIPFPELPEEFLGVVKEIGRPLNCSIENVFQLPDSILSPYSSLRDDELRDLLSQFSPGKLNAIANTSRSIAIQLLRLEIIDEVYPLGGEADILIEGISQLALRGLQ